MMETEGLERERALYALIVLPQRFRADVLADGAISARYGFSTERPIHIGGRTFKRDALFAAFRALADGSAAPIPLSPESLEGAEDSAAAVEMDGDAGLVVLGRTRYRFDDAAMLSTDPAKRSGVLERAFNRRSMSRCEAERLSQAVADTNFNDDAFLSIATALATAPEVFVDEFQAASRTGSISRADLLPEDPRHWEHLVGRFEGSQSVDDYIAKELSQERAVRMEGEWETALAMVSLTFAGPTLIPKGLLDDVAPGERAGVLRSLVEVDDPFSLIGALQLCAEYQTDDWAALGEEVLGKLFADMDRLTAVVQVYGACFVIATAALAEHEKLGRHPPFWRRLAAHAHASLIVRASGGAKGNQDALFNWAMGASGASFIVSVLRDFVSEPRWRPDWIVSTFIIADLYGRALATVKQLSDDAPAGWNAALEIPETWLEDKHALLSAHFPAPIEGARRGLPALAELGDLADHYRNVVATQSVERFLRLTSMVHAFMPPKEVEPAAIAIVRGISRAKKAEERELDGMALALSAHLAALFQSSALADVVAETTVALCRQKSDLLGVEDAVMRLLECNAAYADRATADDALARQLEGIAFAIDDAADLRQLFEFIDALQNVDPDLAQRLGRARAIAHLGVGRLGAA